MNIPDNLKMKNNMHGSGAKGMAIYGYVDDAGIGVRMEARRKDHRSPFVETWFLDALPGREFKSFTELKAAAEPLTDEDLAAVTADYPTIRETKPDSCGNRCRLCPRENQPGIDAVGKSIRYPTWHVVLAYSWKDLHSLSLCDDHLEQYEGNPVGLKKAIEYEVAARKERAVTKRAKPIDPTDDFPF